MPFPKHAHVLNGIRGQGLAAERAAMRAHMQRVALRSAQVRRRRARGRDDEVSAWNPRWEARSLIAQEQATPRPGVRSRADPARPQSLRTRNPSEQAVERAWGRRG